jgi:hypothetical protein
MRPLLRTGGGAGTSSTYLARETDSGTLRLTTCLARRRGHGFPASLVWRTSGVRQGRPSGLIHHHDVVEAYRIRAARRFRVRQRDHQSVNGVRCVRVRHCHETPERVAFLG